jgi:hypothetical protein
MIGEEAFPMLNLGMNGHGSVGKMKEPDVTEVDDREDGPFHKATQTEDQVPPTAHPDQGPDAGYFKTRHIVGMVFGSPPLPRDHGVLTSRSIYRHRCFLREWIYSLDRWPGVPFDGISLDRDDSMGLHRIPLIIIC